MVAKDAQLMAMQDAKEAQLRALQDSHQTIQSTTRASHEIALKETIARCVPLVIPGDRCLHHLQYRQNSLAADTPARLSSAVARSSSSAVSSADFNSRFIRSSVSAPPVARVWQRSILEMSASVMPWMVFGCRGYCVVL